LRRDGFCRGDRTGRPVIASVAVFVRMVHVRHVRVGVFQPLVAVSMGVRFTRWIVGTVFVLVMRVMHVRMCVFEGFVNVLMFVMLGDM
jgi:hypothetical protein